MVKLGDKALPELDLVSLWCYGMNGHELVSTHWFWGVYMFECRGGKGWNMETLRH